MRAAKGETAKSGNGVTQTRIEAIQVMITFIVLNTDPDVLGFEETMEIIYDTMGRREGE